MDFPSDEIIPSLHRAPSAGAIVKKLLKINPALGVQDLIQIMRQSAVRRGGLLGEFTEVEAIDEEKALLLAKASLKGSP